MTTATLDAPAPQVPTGREEAWRFTPLARLRGLVGQDVDLAPAGHPQVEAPRGVGVVNLTGERPLPYDGDLAAVRAWQHAGTATVVTVPKGAVVEDPIRIRVTGSGGSEAGELRIDAGADSSATVVVEHVGSAARTDNVVITAGEGAELTYVTVQEWDRDAVHLSTQSLNLARSARVRHFVITLGGDVVRIAPRVEFTGPGAEVELLGLFFAVDGQHQEHRLHVEHGVAHCASEVVYKGALRGDTTHTVWIGDVAIRPDAVGTRTYEVNRNLVLGDGARADSVPNLEIETGEVVGAGHASATGRFDDEQLFYLQSRGIPAAVARRLVVHGFFADLLSRVALPELAERILARVDTELAEDES